MKQIDDKVAGLCACIALVVITLFIALPVGGDMYTWTDESGVKHFSNAPPPGGQDVVQQAEVKHTSDQYDKWEEQRKSNQERILDESQSNDEPAKKEALAGRRSNKQQGDVVMYTTPTCGYCVRAKAFFTKYGIAYTEYDITADKQANARFKKLNGSGVPLIFVGEKRVPGFNEGLLRRLLGIEAKKP
jgi:glutaredoxin